VTVTEEARHRLYGHLEEVMGEQHAAALLEWVPHGPLASRDDVEHLREAMGLRFAAVDARFDALEARMATKEDVANLRAELHSALRMHSLVIIGAVGTMISAARLFS